MGAGRLAVTPRRCSAVTRRVADWFQENARDLPWRKTNSRGRRDPYRSLVSEAMLQQTQVSRALEKFDAFLTRFPTVRSLASAKEERVLEAWSGLGYYRRAKHLHKAAQAIVADHAGEVPQDTTALMKLPGVGRYTAGAIASLVFGEPEPIVDGNVARVLLRLEGKTLDPIASAAGAWLWSTAASLAQRAHRDANVAAFNEGLMELGALVCKPTGPTCKACPLASLCVARRLGLTETIPHAKAQTKKKTLYYDCALVEDDRGRRLVERRPDDGLWAGLWQPPTLERQSRPAAKKEIEQWIGSMIEKVDSFDHLTSHRRVRFRIWRVERHAAVQLAGRWLNRGRLARLALASPHRRILLEL